MIQSYNSLEKRLNMLDTGKKPSKWYYLSVETDVTYTGGIVYDTPDEALSAIYKDARRRHAAYIAVVSFPFSDGQLQGEDIGFCWYEGSRTVLSVTPEKEGCSFIYFFTTSGTDIDRLVYPGEKPRTEYLDLLEADELRWIREIAGFQTALEYKQRKEQQNPELYPPGWRTNCELLRQKYYDSGYLEE